MGAVAQSISNLQVTLGTALGGSQTLTVTLYDLTLTTAEAVTCVVPNSGTTCSDTTHSYSVPAGDLVVWEIVLNSSTKTTNITIGSVIGAASTFSGNTTTAASATSLVATASANTPMVADGSGNIQPYPALNTVGGYGIWNNGQPLSGLVGQGTGTPTNNTMYGAVLYLNQPQVVGHSAVGVSSAGTSESWYVCIYNSAGTSLLWSGSTTVNSAINAAVISASPYTLQPGTYLVTWEQTGTTAAVLGTWGSSTPGLRAVNAEATRFFSTANTVTGSACPTTTGTLTPVTASAPAAAFTLEP
jgi:hypothetical protein